MIITKIIICCTNLYLVFNFGVHIRSTVCLDTGIVVTVTGRCNDDSSTVYWRPWLASVYTYPCEQVRLFKRACAPLIKFQLLSPPHYVFLINWYESGTLILPLSLPSSTRRAPKVGSPHTHTHGPSDCADEFKNCWYCCNKCKTLLQTVLREMKYGSKYKSYIFF